MRNSIISECPYKYSRNINCKEEFYSFPHPEIFLQFKGDRVISAKKKERARNQSKFFNIHITEKQQTSLEETILIGKLPLCEPPLSSTSLQGGKEKQLQMLP